MYKITDYNKGENSQIYSEENCHLSFMSFDKGMRLEPILMDIPSFPITTSLPFLLHFSSFSCHRLISINMGRYLSLMMGVSQELRSLQKIETLLRQRLRIFC